MKTEIEILQYLHYKQQTYCKNSEQWHTYCQRILSYLFFERLIQLITKRQC